MISPFEVYLIGTADGVGKFFQGVSIFLTAFIIIMIVFTVLTIDEDEKEKTVCRLKSWLRFWVPSCLFLWIFSVIYPSSQTLAAMYVIPPVVKAVQDHKQIEQIPQAVLDLIKSYERKDDHA